MKARLTLALAVAVAATSGCAVTDQVMNPPSGAPVASPQPVATATKATHLWHPAQGLTWQIQFAGALAPTTAEVVDLDGVETTKAQVAALHAQGKKVICYFNAGGYENWRPDRKKFPKKVIGKPLGDWPGERWLDIRKVKTLMPIMTKRIQQCKAKGFDAVDPDNMDGYANAPTGFALKQKHAVAYLKALSKAAHARGLAIGLKGALEIIGKATPMVEFAINEQCLQYDECAAYDPLTRVGKPVFHIEYQGSMESICARVPAGFSTVRKHLDLDAWAEYC
ncbi:MAG: endo alpha-1,4 polygalactosaminidase [Propionibacteriales bacterium]|nr:endo alpha-1,4 polygalactosaminidase [Propionibacteriales bacterium]